MLDGSMDLRPRNPRAVESPPTSTGSDARSEAPRHIAASPPQTRTPSLRGKTRAAKARNLLRGAARLLRRVVVMKRNDPDRLFLFKNPDSALGDHALGESYLRGATGGEEVEDDVDVDFDRFADLEEDLADDPPLFI